jgi:eukaryotic-like serine/threonine-protein kinase
MPLAPGDRLGPYEIVAPIGAGAMGEVFRARDTRLGRDVAIKVLPSSVATLPDRLQRFAQEAQAAAALNHPNVVAVYDVHTEGDTPYVVSELLEGETLRAALGQGALAPRRTIEIASQVAAGLAAAHQKGIVHRDVKPENIFLTTDGRTKLLDFGIARIAGPADADLESTRPGGPAPTQPGVVLGTVGYMAPEQVRGEPVDWRADVFALGAVCYEMLTGCRAFQGDTAVEVMAAIVRSDPPPMSPAQVPPGIDRAVRRCLEKSPALRFQSTSDVAYALDALAAGTTSTSTGPAPAPARRTAWVAVVAAAVGGLLLGLAGVLTTGRGDTPERPLLGYEARTFDHLPVMNARFMPDGQTIVYSAASRGHVPSLYMIGPSAEAPQRLDVSDAHLLSVSRTGELAIITGARHLAQRLYVGTLARMTIGSSPRPLLDHVREADWGPDGESLATIVDLGDGRDRLEYPAGVTVYEASGYLSDPRVSPDGSRVAFVAHSWRFDDRGRVMVVTRGNAARALTPELWSVQGLSWTPDGTTLVFSGNAAGGSLMQPMAVAASGATPHHTVLTVPARLIVHDIGRDGRWLAVREDLTFGVRALVPDAEGERELGWLGSSGARALSADGRQLLMVDVGSRSGASYGVVLRPTDGSGAVRLGTGSAERLSPDGRWAAAILSSPPEVVLYPTGPGTPRRVAGGRFDPITSVQWFPDGLHVLVCGTESGHLPRCYRAGLDGSGLTPVTEEGVHASLAPDGQTVLLTARDGTVRVGRLGEAASRPVSALTPADRIVGWSRDGASVFVQRGFEVPVHVERVHLATGQRALVRTIVPEGIHEPVSVYLADWVDDGRWYAYNYTVVPSVLFVVTGARP